MVRAGIRGELLGTAGRQPGHTQHWSAALRPLVHPQGLGRQRRRRADQPCWPRRTIHAGRRISVLLRGEETKNLVTSLLIFEFRVLVYQLGFLARDVIYTSRAYAISVRLSVCDGSE